MSSPLPPGAAPRSPWPRAAGLGLALAAVVAVVVVAFSWPGVASEPAGVPIVVAGPDAQLTQLHGALEQRASGVFEVEVVGDRAAAVAAIESREAYGAILLGAAPEVLTASAASPAVAQQLAGFAVALEEQVQAAVAAQVPDGVTPPVVTVTVTDVVPLAAADPRGVVLASATFPLVLGGLIGGIAITMSLVGAMRRLLALAVFVVLAALGIAAILQGWFGALHGSYVLNSAVFALGLLAIGAPIVGLAALVGRAGVAIGPVLFLLIANPISSAAQPVEFLPEPWGAVGQWFPPGAGATLLRDASYFPAADTLVPWLVLAGWSAVGVLLALAGHLRARGGAVADAREEANAAD